MVDIVFASLIKKLKHRQRDIEHSLLDHLGDKTMVQLDDEANVIGGVKYDEGRLGVLGEMIRLLRTEPTHEMIQAAMAQSATQWKHDLERRLTSRNRSIAWIAYSQGGVDMYAEIARMIAGM